MAGAQAIREPVGILFWWTTTAILGLLTLVNVCCRLYRLVTRPRQSDRCLEGKIQQTNFDAESGVSDRHSLSLPTRCWRAIWAGMEKWLFLSSVPAPRFSWSMGKRDIPLMEIFWSAGYAAGCFTLALYGTKWAIPTVANQAGWVSAAQIPLIIALSQKNNLIAFLTGIRAERLAFLHRFAGRTCLLCAWLHVGLHLWLSKGFMFAMWHKPLYLWGAIGIMSYTLLLLTSVRNVRQKLYEFFLVTHICLAALTIAGFMMHWSAMRIWLYPGVGLWAGDRLLRLLRVAINNRFKSPKVAFDAHQMPSHATLSLLTPSTLKLTFPAPRLPWSAGQHFYVVVPGMSTFPWEAHPFTPCTVPESGELSFLVRVRDGFTGRMKHRLETVSRQRGLEKDGAEMRIRAAVEGPYGLSRKLSRFDGVLLIAGGSGISFAIGHMLQIIEQAKRGRSRVKNARIVWMVKSMTHLDWITPFLELHAHSIPADLNVEIHVHVTRQVTQVIDFTTTPRTLEVRSGSWATWAPNQRRPSDNGREAKRARTQEKWGIAWGDKRRSLQIEEAAAFRVARNDQPVGILKKTEVYASPLEASISNTPSEEEMYGRSYTPVTRIGHHFLNMPTDSAAPSIASSSRRPSLQSSQQSLIPMPVPRPKGITKRVAFADQVFHPSHPSMPHRRPSGMPEAMLPPRSESLQQTGLPAWQSAPLYTLGSSNKRKDPPQYYDITSREEEYDIPVLDFSAPREPQFPHLERQTSSKSIKSAISLDSDYSEDSCDPAFVAGPSYTPPTTSTEKLDFPIVHGGYAHLLYFHEGRADIKSIIEEARAQVGNGTLSVNVCGPGSLLRGTRDAVRDISTMKAAWRRDGRIDFHAETFGW